MMPRVVHDPLDEIAANSFRNFHALGLDYLCLLRSPAMTLKAYFYDRDDAPTPELVCPHDHRYPFATTVLSGRCDHFRYWDEPILQGIGKRHQRFAWRTPLNGGDGFTWEGEAVIECVSRERYGPGASYWCTADEIHTIAVQAGTVLLLCQLADTVPMDEATHTFVAGADREPPAIGGLYDTMPLAYAEGLLARLNTALAANGCVQ